MKKLQNEIFIQAVCQHLDASIAHLDPLLSARLNTSREDALNAYLPGVITNADTLSESAQAQFGDNNTVSADIEFKLNQIRRQAIAQLNTEKSPTTLALATRIRCWLDSRLSSFSWSLPTTMLATACVLVTVVSIFYGNFRPAGSLSLDEEISLVASGDDIELYENLDFYLWLANEESLTL